MYIILITFFYTTYEGLNIWNCSKVFCVLHFSNRSKLATFCHADLPLEIILSLELVFSILLRCRRGYENFICSSRTSPNYCTGIRKLVMLCCLTMREKCTNTEFFLVRIFLYLVRLQENTDQKKLRIRTLFTQCKRN